MVKIYFIGVIILVTAILLNGLVSKLGIAGWYQALQMLSEKGSRTFAMLRVTDYLWLLIIYPFLLGCSYKLGEYLFGLLSHPD
jgi:hypothetical protein